MHRIVIKLMVISLGLLMVAFTLASDVKTLTINVGKFKQVSGVLHYQLLPCPTGQALWADLSIVSSGQVDVTQASIELSIELSVEESFEHLMGEKYIVRVFQDLNNNTELDYYTSGAPKEPTGFSNNPNLILGMPSPHDVCFAWSTQQALLIEINNKRRNKNRRHH